MEISPYARKKADLWQGLRAQGGRLYAFYIYHGGGEFQIWNEGCENH